MPGQLPQLCVSTETLPHVPAHTHTYTYTNIHIHTRTTRMLQTNVSEGSTDASRLVTHYVRSKSTLVYKNSTHLNHCHPHVFRLHRHRGPIHSSSRSDPSYTCFCQLGITGGEDDKLGQPLISVRGCAVGVLCVCVCVCMCVCELLASLTHTNQHTCTGMQNNAGGIEPIGTSSMNLQLTHFCFCNKVCFKNGQAQVATHKKNAHACIRMITPPI